jgi:hypothetical protein
LNETSKTDLSGILLRDSCYLAIGLSYYYLYDFIDLGAWLQSDLIKELQNNDPR